MLLGRKQKYMHLLQKTAISYWSSFWIKCMFPFINISILKLSPESDDRFARKTSFPVEKRRSTAALDGIAVLYLINNSIKNDSPRNAASVKKSFDFESGQVLTKFWALFSRDLWPLALSSVWITLLKKSSSLLLFPLMPSLFFSFESLFLYAISRMKNELNWSFKITA